MSRPRDSTGARAHQCVLAAGAVRTPRSKVTPCPRSRRAWFVHVEARSVQMGETRPGMRCTLLVCGCPVEAVLHRLVEIGWSWSSARAPGVTG